MDYGQNTRIVNQYPDAFDQPNLTVGKGDNPAGKNSMDPNNLNSDLPAHSRLGNTALNVSEASNNNQPGIESAIPLFPPESEPQLGQISDIKSPQVGQHDYGIESSETIQHFKDGKASVKDVKELKNAIDDIARDTENSDNAAKIYEFRRAACEALESTKEAA